MFVYAAIAAALAAAWYLGRTSGTATVGGLEAETRGRKVQATLGRLSLPEAEAFIQGGLVGADLYQLKNGQVGITRDLLDGRVRYERRDKSEHWQTIREMRENGNTGDCEDLAAAVAAERTLAGHPSTVVLIPIRAGLQHAVVKDLRTGQLFDPSRTGGMGKASG